MKVGETLSFTRTFTVQEVSAFAVLTRDRAPWHLNADASGRVVTHGLLTVSLATEIGGAMGFMARQFDISFLRPVRTGEPITCTLTLTELSEAPSSAMGAPLAAATRLTADVSITKADGTEVVHLVTRGVLPRPLAEVEAEKLGDLRSRL